MVDTAFMIDPETGVVALYDEPNTSGSRFDPAAPRNAPLGDLAGNLDKVRYHSAASHFELGFSGTTTVSHAAVAGVGAASNLASAYGTNAGAHSDILFEHDLGYLPYALVVVDGKPVHPGMPVQIGTNGAARYACVWVDETYLGIDTICTIGNTTLPAIDIDYDYEIILRPPTPEGDVLFSFDPETGITTMGLGQVSSDRKYLQAVDGGTPFGIPLGRTCDLGNGAVKWWMADGTTFAPVPSGLKSYLPSLGGTSLELGGETLGASMGYSGSYAGPSFVQLQLGADTGETDGFAIDEDGAFTVNYGGIQVVNSAGRFVLGLPDADDLETTITVSFADFDKQWMFNWRWTGVCTSTVGPTFNIREVGDAYIGAKSGTTENVTVLASAPAGANFVVGHVRVTRTTAPASNWFGQTIGLKLPEDKWIPVFGSLLLEEQVGMARAASLYIDDSGDLVLHQQQSVTVPPYWAVTANGSASGVRTMTYGLAGLPSFPVIGLQYDSGEWALQTEGAPTLPVYYLGGTGLSGSATALSTAIRRTTANGFVGASAHSVTDVSDYHSEYSFELKLKYCRLAAAE